MPNILDTVQISGSSYELKDKNATSVSAVTQEEYDNLPSSAKTSNTFFVITDAQAGDLTQYWTSAQTQSAITEATSGKADSSAVTQEITAAVSSKVDSSSVVSSVTSASTDSEIPTAKAVWNVASQGGGGGGGSSYTAGRGIDITSDVISVSLPISAGTGNYSIIEGGLTSATSECAHAEGWCTKASGARSHAEGEGTVADNDNAHVEGYYTIANNDSEHACGKYNVSRLGPDGSYTTLFTVGNGTADNARHNAFEIRQNGDIYLSYNGNDIKLQDLIADIYSKLPTS